MKFSEMKYERPDLDKVLAQCEEYAKKMAAAQSGEELVQLYREENAMMAHYHTASCLASIHYTQDTRDEYWSGEQEWFDATGPAVSNAARNVAEAILSNPHAKALEEAFGTRILPSLRNLVLSMDDRVIELQKEENALTSAYQKLYGGAMAELDGKQLTIPQLTLYKQSTDPAMRRKAYEAEAVYFDAHRAEFDEIYDKMVKNRNEQARILGYNDYSELSYIRMNRIGYGPAEVAAFRQEVVEQVVPMIQKALALRNKRTGIENPMFWDSTISFADGNPVPHGSYDELMAGARKMYHELSPETAEFIDFMQDNEMFDVLSRPGKMSGGYEEMLPDYKTPFIFANWNGTAGDVDVLTHEAGHALEGYLAARSPKNIPEDIQCPGMESAEIHSMSMEFLTAPWHHLFFKEDTDKYELLHAEDSKTLSLISLYLISPCVIISAFQVQYTPDVLHGLLLALAAAVLLHIQLPAVTEDSLDMVGSAIGPISMIILGMLMAGMNFKKILGYRRLWLVTALRLVGIPLAAVALLKLSGLAHLVPDGQTILLVSLLATCTPSASTITQMAQIYGKDADYASAINVVTTLLCIFTMPLMVALYQL